MKTLRIDRTREGNRVLRVGVEGGRGFSVQTLGNLPRTHRDGVGPWTWGELADWVQRHGTERQRGIVAD